MSMLARHNPELSDDELYDRLTASVDTAEPEPCRVCGEELTRFGRTCRRCLRNMDEDRERREIER